MKEMKGKAIALAMAGTIFLSGVSGFGGTYLANQLEIDKEQNVASLKTDTTQNTGANATLLEEDKNPIVMQLATASAPRKILSIPEIALQSGVSVVEITTEIVATDGRMRQLVSEGAGSGVIIRSDGYIATNNHVIDGASKITVRLKTGETRTATLIGKDAQTDLAVIKIEGANLKAAVFGDSGPLVVGELAIAIGNPLGQLGGTVTEGIISALDRDIVIDGENMKLLQTSAAINPGNSGGGLFNAYGELIGIVNAKSSGSDIEGLGFAIPIKTAKSVLQDLIQFGYVQGRIDLGLIFVDIPDARTALYYRVSNPGLYVFRASKSNGFKSGDRIVSINGTVVNSTSEFKAKLATLVVGKTAEIVVERGQQNVTLSVTLDQAKS